jgi:hypothetical protein
MARRNFYTNPGVVREDFGAFARGVASTFRPAKRAEFKEVDLQAFDPIERNAFYEVDGVKYDINEDAFILANERFVDVINTQRDEFQRAHGDKKAQAEIQKDMLGYNDVNKFGAAFEALENVEEFDSNLQFFFPDENGNATNISAGELGKILSGNANALTVAKKQNKNGITHYGYEVQTGSGKVFLSGTSINEDYLISNLKQSYNQAGIIDNLVKKYKGNRKTSLIQAADGATYVSPDSVAADNFEATRAVNEVFNTNSNYSEMFPSAQRQYNQAIRNGDFVSILTDEANDLQKMQEYLAEEYKIRTSPEAYIRSTGTEKQVAAGFPKGHAIPKTEENKDLFQRSVAAPKKQTGSGSGTDASAVNEAQNFLDQYIKGIKSYNKSVQAREEEPDILPLQGLFRLKNHNRLGLITKVIPGPPENPNLFTFEFKGKDPETVDFTDKNEFDNFISEIGFVDSATANQKVINEIKKLPPIFGLSEEQENINIIKGIADATGEETIDAKIDQIKLNMDLLTPEEREQYRRREIMLNTPNR